MNNKYCVDCGHPCINCTKENNAITQDKFKPGDKVQFIYQNRLICGQIMYRVTAENYKRNKSFIGQYVIHSPGMSSTLPEEQLALIKGE